jgi:glucokinase
MAGTYYAGIDLGATHIRAAVADGDGDVLSLDRRKTPRGPRGVDVTDAVLDSLRAACAEFGIDPGEIAAAGIGSIGPLDLAAGTVVGPANLPDGVDVIPLREPVSELLDADRVSLHNDTTAGVIGERYYSDLNPDDMVYLTISSGIGAGVTVDGSVLHGWDGNAGEIGHVVVDADRRRVCGCGRPGHWEAYCSGANIPEYARDIHEREGIDTALPVADPEFTAADVFAEPEDPLADEVIDRIADWNAIGVSTIVQTYAPLVIAIGGAVALENESLVVDPIVERVPDMVLSNVPEIRPTSLGDEVVLYGAIASAISDRVDEGPHVH